MSIEEIKQALDALDSDNPDIQLRTAIVLRQAIEAAEKRERNFCERCGKRLFTDHIHTCTPPAEAEKHEVSQEPVAWEAPQGYGIKRFISQSQYEKFSPEIRKWYKPFKCSSCDTSPPKHEPCPFVVSTREGTHHCSLSQRQPLKVDKDGWYWLSKNECIHVDVIRKVEAAHGIKGEA